MAVASPCPQPASATDTRSGADGLFGGITNPIAALCVGILATVLVQSSSVTTATIVGLVVIALAALFVLATIAPAMATEESGGGDESETVEETTTTTVPETTTTTPETTTTLPPPTTVLDNGVPIWQPYEPDPPLDGFAGLTGLPTNDDVTDRPILAVKIDNYVQARPQWGLDRADAIIEENVEGVTRFVGLFHTDLPERVGPVRSARTARRPSLQRIQRCVRTAWRSEGAEPGGDIPRDLLRAAGLLGKSRPIGDGLIHRVLAREAVLDAEPKSRGTPNVLFQEGHSGLSTGVEILHDGLDAVVIEKDSGSHRGKAVIQDGGTHTVGQQKPAEHHAESSETGYDQRCILIVNVICFPGILGFKDQWHDQFVIEQKEQWRKGHGQGHNKEQYG